MLFSVDQKYLMERKGVYLKVKLIKYYKNPICHTIGVFF